MCGIVGIIGAGDVAGDIVEGLRRLEYRGYDSAGIATIVGGQIIRRRTVGKLRALADSLAGEPLTGRIGIGHTRWATHGAPSERNAHPHATRDVAIVHNGIIENFQELRAELEGAGHVFASETDSEVIAQLITHELAKSGDAVAALAASLKRLEGAFAIAAIVRGEEDLLLGARRGSPLALASEDGQAILASDAMALAPFARSVVYLEEGDFVRLTRAGYDIWNSSGARANRPVRQISAATALADKGEHRHFMAKEIHEQPEVVGHTLAATVDASSGMLRRQIVPFDWARQERVTLVACGTAYYACLVGKYWFEQIARLPAEADVASEFRYREAPMPKGGAAIFVSQSGETADTLAALRYAASQDQHVVGVVNVPDSTIAREAEIIVPTKAGAEIGVASTKAFSAQLTVLVSLALSAAAARGHLKQEDEHAAVRSLLEVPRLITEALQQERHIAAIAAELSKSRDTLFIGRGRLYPLALEGALKLKEISYIHAEGYAGGELKHGPIALIDEEMPVVALAPSGPLFEKMASNIKEVAARGGQVILISDKAGIARAGDDAAAIIEMPETNAYTSPLVYAIPLQLLAYHAAVAKGTDVDQPRNLAKSVTVE